MGTRNDRWQSTVELAGVPFSFPNHWITIPPESVRRSMTTFLQAVPSRTGRDFGFFFVKKDGTLRTVMPTDRIREAPGNRIKFFCKERNAWRSTGYDAVVLVTDGNGNPMPIEDIEAAIR